MGSCPSLTNSGKVFRTAMGMGFLALLLGVSPDDAGATVYDYGVMILEGATAGGKSSEWCSPNGPTCGGVDSGLTTLTHSLGESATSTLPGTNVTSSASTTTTGTAGMGDLHLSVVSKADGSIGASGVNEEFWTDTLRVGNQAPANMPLLFQVTLDLSGSDLAQSSGNGQGGGSSAVAFSQSNFSISDNYGHSASNVQYICNRSMAGKGVSCGTGWESAPKSYTTVFTTDPGATIILNGLLTGETTSGGSTISYPYGNSGREEKGPGTTGRQDNKEQKRSGIDRKGVLRPGSRLNRVLSFHEGKFRVYGEAIPVNDAGLWRPWGIVRDYREERL
ncbi:MAG: hypothetical protein M0Z25_03270 [Nitrospiraceae bacterium]|nr:hypothetical protein [Nitrospiraceae bacterium]